MSAAVAQRAPERGRRHCIRDVEYARQLHEAGWNDVEIVEQLAKRGVIVTKGTVGRWVKPHRHEAWAAAGEHHSALKAARRGRRPLGYPHARPEYKLARMKVLRELNVSFRAIAAVMNFDFGDTLTEDQVRHALLLDRFPTRAPRAKAAS